jgi:hypothetical protein
MGGGIALHLVRLLLAEAWAVCVATSTQTSRLCTHLFGLIKARRGQGATNSGQRLRPSNGVEWRRIGIGYGLIVLALLFVCTRHGASNSSASSPSSVSGNRDSFNEVFGESSRPSRPTTSPANSAVEEYFRNRVNQQRQDQRDALEKTRVCKHCGGSGWYRYVDANGQIVSQQCPRCRGSGKVW